MGTSVLEILHQKKDNATCDHWDYSVNSVPFSFSISPITWALSYWNLGPTGLVNISLGAPGGCYSVTVLGANTFSNSQSPRFSSCAFDWLTLTLRHNLFCLLFWLLHSSSCKSNFQGLWTSRQYLRQEKSPVTRVPVGTAEARGKACHPFLPLSKKKKTFF